MTGRAPDRVVYFEIRQVGGLVQCAAIDGATGVEVSVFGPAGVARADIERLALAKLRRRLGRDDPEKVL